MVRHIVFGSPDELGMFLKKCDRYRAYWCAHPCVYPDPLTKKTLIQDDLRDLHPIDRGAGGQDQAVELQRWCDHLPEDKIQVQPLNQEPHVRLRPRS